MISKFCFSFFCTSIDETANDTYVFSPLKSSRSPYLGQNGSSLHYRHVSEIANEKLYVSDNHPESMNINGNNLYDYKIANKKQTNFEVWQKPSSERVTLANSAQNLLSEGNSKQKIKKSKSVQKID